MSYPIFSILTFLLIIGMPIGLAISYKNLGKGFLLGSLIGAITDFGALTSISSHSIQACTDTCGIEYITIYPALIILFFIVGIVSSIFSAFRSKKNQKQGQNIGQ
jgi:hypothetical protein